MRALSVISGVGVFAFILVLLREAMEHAMWNMEGSSAPTTLEFANSIFDEWSIATVVLGVLLAMAMVGASYLVRDERLVNLLWDLGDDAGQAAEALRTERTRKARRVARVSSTERETEDDGISKEEE
jgi:hypothetical protein